MNVTAIAAIIASMVVAGAPSASASQFHGMQHPHVQNCPAQGCPGNVAGFVALGTGTTWNFRFYPGNSSGPIACSPASVGGDPAPGASKECKFIELKDFMTSKTVVKDGQGFGLNQPKIVIFGAENAWNARLLQTGSHKCEAAALGGDPAPGKGKECRKLNDRVAGDAARAAGALPASASKPAAGAVSGAASPSGAAGAPSPATGSAAGTR